MALCGIESVSSIDFRFCYIYSMNSFYLNLFIRTSRPLPKYLVQLSNGVNLAQNASSFILIDYGAISGVD